MHRTDDIPAFQSYASSETELAPSDFSWLLSQMPTRGEGHEMMPRKQPLVSSRELGRYSVSGRRDDTRCIDPCSLLHIVLFHVGFCCLEGSPSTSNSEQCNTLPPSPQQSEALTHFPFPSVFSCSFQENFTANSAGHPTCYCTSWALCHMLIVHRGLRKTHHNPLVTFLSVTNTVRKGGLVLVYRLRIFTILEGNTWQGT